MTEDRKTPDPGAADDPRVSTAYRDLARERTPAHLDRAVLRAAADAARPQYSRLRLWTRPTAWAAMVLLSAGLLFEYSQSPQQDAVPAPAALAPAVEVAPQDASKLDVTAERQRSDAPPRQEKAAAELRELTNRSADTLGQAEEMMRFQQGPSDADTASAEPAARRAPAAAGAIATQSFREDAPACGNAARSEPESWLECIRALEQAGLAEAAGRERELFRDAYPDVESP